ncbi:MAG: hypothetical protein U1E37_08455 [Sphingomonadaceae bacterium]
MTKLRIFLLPLASFMAQPAYAYCPGWEIDGLRYYSVPREFNRASYVAVVKVSNETWLDEDGKRKPSEFDGNIGAYYSVSLVWAYKGRPPPQMRLFSENSTARFSMRVGKEYVVFITKEEFNRPVGMALTVDTCGNSPVQMSRASRLIARLKRLSR